MPKKRPMPTEKVKEIRIGAKVITGGTSANFLNNSTREMPKAIPKIPPMRPIITASIKNCVIMVRYVAPRALRIPISLVRSVTETIIIFIMPMPPTRSEMAATLPRKRVSVAVVEFIVSIRLVMLLMVKSSSLPIPK